MKGHITVSNQSIAIGRMCFTKNTLLSTGLKFFQYIQLSIPWTTGANSFSHPFLWPRGQHATCYLFLVNNSLLMWNILLTQLSLCSWKIGYSELLESNSKKEKLWKTKFYGCLLNKWLKVENIVIFQGVLYRLAFWFSFGRQ